MVSCPKLAKFAIAYLTAQGACMFLTVVSYSFGLITGEASSMDAGHSFSKGRSEANHL
jgi:hypothetical protein